MTEPRRPIGRRLMAALFVVMLAPMSGWYFVTDLTRPERLDPLRPEQQAQLLEWQHEVRRRLALTFLVAVGVMGGVVLYVRRSITVPLTRLADRARDLQTGPWVPPPERNLHDEIEDLSRALDESVRTLEQRADEAVRFAVSLSHELRTPLAAIKGAAEVLGEPNLQAADRTRFVDNIAVESARLERLVAGLLDLERARQGQPAHPGRCDLTKTVRQALERTAPSWSRKNLDVQSRLPPDLPQANIDADRATRVLLGLLENAIKFSPRDGVIKVAVTAHDRHLQLIVEDAGSGVDDDMKPKIFDRAFVGDRSAGARGTGLGLAIVHSLVVGAKGEVHVEDATGGGARFVARLPHARQASDGHPTDGVAKKS